MLSRLAVALVLMGLIAPTAEAQRVQSEKATRRQLERWIEDLETAHQELLEDKVEKAMRRTDKTRSQMLERLRSGLAAPLLFGQVGFLRALAAAKTGDVEAAKWDFQVALEFVEAYDSLDLGGYGEASAILEEARTERRERLQREAEPDTEDESAIPTEKIVPPRKKFAPQPVYPPAHKVTCGQGRVVLLAIIDKKGRVTQPAVKQPGDPILLFAAFDAVRHWKFEPARRQGEPVAVYYNLTLNFRVDAGCALPLDPFLGPKNASSSAEPSATPGG